MRKRFNSFFALLTVIIMTITMAGGNLFNSNARVFAKEVTSQSATVNDVIKILTDELSKKGNAASTDEKIALYKAGDTSIDKTSLIKKDLSSTSSSIGTRVKNSDGIMDLDEDPSTYDGKDLIKDIVDEVNILKADEKTRFFGNETKAIELLDRFNDKYPDKKVNYNTNNAMKFLLADLNANKKSSFNVPQNMALGLKVFLKHKDIEGVKDALTKCKESMNNWQINDGSFSNSNKFSTTQHILAVQKLAESGEKLDSTEWTKGDKNPIDALFNSWDGKQFKKSSGTKDEYAYMKVLNSLLSLKAAGYGEYRIKGANFDSEVKEVSKKSCNVKVRVEANDHTIIPSSELTADNFDLSPYGGSQLDTVMAVNSVIKVLENSGIDCKDKNKFGDSCSYITNIDGIRTNSVNPNFDGWMYYVNNTYVPVGIADYNIKDGDSIVMFFQEDYNKITYSWFDKEQANIKTGEKLTLNLNGTHFDINTNKTVKSLVNDAKILVDNKAMALGGKNVLTDKDGNAVLKFDKAGTYTISAERFDSETKKRDITRPYCKVVVEQGQVNAINKQELEKYSNKAQDLVKNAAIGNEVGKYTQEAVDKLKSQINSANELMKKSEVTQEEIDAEAIKLQGSINIFKESANKNKDLQNITNEVLGYYNGWVDNKYKSFDYITTLALRRAGMDTDTLNKKINIYGMESLHNTERNIMTLIGANTNPENYKNKDYLSKLMLNDFTKESNSEYIAKAVIAIDMVKADYDKGKLINLLLSKAHDEKDGKISYGSMQASEEYEANLTTTGWTLIALSNHRDMDKCSSTIEGIKKYLKANQKETGLIDNCTNTALLIQGLIALGENPLDDYWCVKNNSDKITLVDAILKCKYNNGFGEYPSSNMIGANATPHALAALTDLNLNSSMYRELRFKDAGSPVKISIDGDKVINIYKGQYLDLTAKAYDLNNLVVKDGAILWKSSNDNVIAVKDGTLTTVSEGEAEITAYISGSESIKDTVTIKVIIPPVTDYSKVIKNEVDFLKEHYKAYGKYEFLASPVAVIAGMDKKEIGSKIQGYTRYNTALNYSRMAISILGAGLEPRNYVEKDKTVNYIEILEKAQQTEGLDNGKFIITQSIDKDSIEAQAYSIITLDLAGANYNKKDAVLALLSMLNDKTYKNANSYKSIKTEAVAVTALAKHKDVEGVQTKIDELLKFIKSNQNKDGGFDIAAGNNSPVATGAVITALYANGIDPLSIEWSKDGKTVIDGILKSKFTGADSSKSGYAQGDDLDFENYEATYYAFAAFVQLQNKKSIFDMMDKVDTNVKVDKVTINKGALELKEGQIEELAATILPEDATNKKLTWTSSNKEVAVVDEKGKVTGLKEGKTIIIVKTQDRDKTAECNITVRPKNIDETVNGLKVEKITTENEFKNGSQAKLQFKVSNYQDESKKSTLTVGLFDKDGKLVDYVIAEQKIESGKYVILTGCMNIPKAGQYKLKAFVWDNLDQMRPLYDVTEITIK